jgi:hypothetical protein
MRRQLDPQARQVRLALWHVVETLILRGAIRVVVGDLIH